LKYEFLHHHINYRKSRSQSIWDITDLACEFIALLKFE